MGYYTQATNKFISNLVPVILLSLSVLTQTVSAKSIVFKSTETQSTVIELYTSEGCSSCPPADQWIENLQKNSKLWKQIIPIAFHVDYWNYLGWKDKFANNNFSKRQRKYNSIGNSRSVYTPGFFVNGQEWSSWFRRSSRQIALSRKKTGKLTVILKNNILDVEFTPVNLSPKPMSVHLAYLGMNIKSKVDSGENDGKILKHSFVVLEHQSLPTRAHQGKIRKKLPFRLKKYKGHTPGALVVWLSYRNDPTPLQAVGGWLNQQ